MKTTSVLVITLLSALLASCGGLKKSIPNKNYDEVSLEEPSYTGPALTEYIVIATSPIPMYGPKGFEDVRYDDIPIGDTLIIIGKSLSNSSQIIYKSTPIIAPDVAYKVRTHQQRVLNKHEKALLKPMTVVAYGSKFTPRPAADERNYVEEISSEYSASPSSSTIHTGPRGGRYYINSNGNKTYLKSGSGSSRSYKSRSTSRKR